MFGIFIFSIHFGQSLVFRILQSIIARRINIIHLFLNSFLFPAAVILFYWILYLNQASQ